MDTSPFQTIVDALHHWSVTKPNTIAYTFFHGEKRDEITYAQLNEKARMIAGWLQSQGACRGDRAMLLFQPGLDYIAAFMGCLYAGVIAVPAYPPQTNHSLGQLQKIIQDAQIKFILSEAGIKEKIRHLPAIIGCFDEMDPSLSIVFQPVDIEATSLAIIQYTSGSTGDPKGVMTSHGNLVDNIAAVFRVHGGPLEHEVGCSWLPPYHTMGLIGGILFPLYFGFPDFLMTPMSFLQNPKLWLDIISKEKVTVTQAPNFAYDLCVKAITEDQVKELDLSHWRIVMNGAEPITRETVKNFIRKFGSSGFPASTFRLSYGITEATMLVASSKGLRTTQISKEHLKDGKISPTVDEDNIYHLVSCGPAIFGHEIQIIDPATLLPCTKDRVGEIWVRGPSVAKGYWNRPDLTQEVFHAQIQGDDSGKHYLRTGDLGWMDEQGYLYITGRLKDMIILNGRNHYPQDVEKTCSCSHGQLINNGMVAFTIEDENGKEQLVLVQEIKQGSENFPDVFQSIQKSLWEGHGLLAQRIVLIQAATLPKTATGKVQRRLTRQLLIDRKLIIEAEWNAPKGDASIQNNSIIDQREEPSTLVVSLQGISAEEQGLMLKKHIRQIVARSIGISPDHLSDQANFFELGMDSIKSVAFAAQCQNLVGNAYKIPETLVFDYPTIEKVSGFLISFLNTTKKSQESTPYNAYNAETVSLIQQDCIFPDFSAPPPSPETQKMNHIFITGSTGIVGSALLKNILSFTTSSITCLVKAESEDSAWKKLRDKLKENDAEIPDLTDRIRIQLGDLEKPLLGMSESAFLDLSSSVDAIYHVGAKVNHVLPYEALRKANVHSTVEILRLASTGKRKQIHYISSFTAYTSQDHNTEGNIPEDFFYNQDKPSSQGGYQQSKWVSEKLLQHAHERGFPVSVYRLCFCLDDYSQKKDHSQVKVKNINHDHLVSFIKGCMQLGYAPDYNDHDLPVLPVSLVAETIFRISLLNTGSSPIFHLVPWQSFSWSCLWKTVNSRGYPMTIVPLQQWLDNHLAHIGDCNALYPFLPYYKNKDKNVILSQIPNLSCAKIRRVIESSQMRPLVITEGQVIDVLLGG
ncbi:MAG: thioester reductase domain-containing protein [Alphaproteobacteria bacterium]|nr:thioester reductase domain-containing protein [Alphaproteobacteria bacterium]